MSKWVRFGGIKKVNTLFFDLEKVSDFHISTADNSDGTETEELYAFARLDNGEWMNLGEVESKQEGIDAIGEMLDRAHGIKVRSDNRFKMLENLIDAVQNLIAAERVESGLPKGLSIRDGVISGTPTGDDECTSEKSESS